MGLERMIPMPNMARFMFGIAGARLVYCFWLGFILAGCGRLATPIAVGSPQASATLPVSVSVTLPPTPRATATPRPATPIATFTPTVTPTPIIYIVQAGDTLLNIAIQFERTTEEIQTANGIADPRFLQIGQEIIIPPPKLSPEDPPTPTPTPPVLVVSAINFQQTRQGTLWCLGEVNNPGSVSLAEVVIEASLLDGAGVVLARGVAYTQLDVIQSGQSAPFAILFDSPPGSFAQYQVTAVSGVPISDQARYYFDLETFDVHGSPEGLATYRLKGQLRNWGDSDAELIRLVAVAYDADNRVLAQRQAELAVTVRKAGATTPFDLDLTIPTGIVDHYKVLAQALKGQ
jgi:LysM repeat protein